jgi:hypothetical protein
MPLVFLGNRRRAYDLPPLLRQHVSGKVVPRVTPEGGLSCRRCMISTIAPGSLSLSRRPAGQHPARGDGDPGALRRRLEFGNRLTLRREPGRK